MPLKCLDWSSWLFSIISQFSLSTLQINLRLPTYIGCSTGCFFSWWHYLESQLFSSFASGIKLSKYNDGDVPLKYSALSFGIVFSIVLPALLVLRRYCSSPQFLCWKHPILMQTVPDLWEIPTYDIYAVLPRHRYPISYPRRTIWNIWC
jgi:hypothetical protein